MGGELADQKSDSEHYTECDEVLGVADGECEVGLHKKEIEGEHADDGSDDRRAAAEAGGDNRYAHEKDHHDVGFGQAELVTEPAEKTTDGADDGSGAIISPIDGAGGRRGLAGRRLAPFAGNDVDIDVGRAGQELLDDRNGEPALPPRLGRFADDNLRDVATAGEVEQCVGDIGADERGGFGAELLGEP